MKLQTSHSFYRTDLGIALLLLAIVLISKAPTLNLPYHWDEAGAYMGPAHWLNQNGILSALPGRHPPGTFFGHPPGIYVSLVLWFRLVGETIWGPHLFAVIFGFLGLYYTYLLGSHLENRGAGLIAALLLFGTPMYFAQSGMVLGDIPITALGVMSVYYALRRRLGIYLICSIYMVLMKETSIAIVVALVIYLFRNQRYRNGIIRHILPYGIPLLVLGMFFLWQKMATGFFFPNPFMAYNQVVQVEPYQIARKAYWVFECAFLKQHRWILSTLILVHIIVCRRSVWRQEYILFTLIGSFFFVAFSFIFFMTRYLLPFMPYLCLVSASAICALGKKTWIQGAVTVVILIAFVTQYFGYSFGYGCYDDSMEYMDVIEVNRQGCKYIEENFPHTQVVTVWPVLQIIQQPFLGYVHNTIPACKMHEKLRGIVVYVDNPGEKSDDLMDRVRREKYILLKRFEKNGKYLEIYVPPFRPRTAAQTAL